MFNVDKMRKRKKDRRKKKLKKVLLQYWERRREKAKWTKKQLGENKWVRGSRHVHYSSGDLGNKVKKKQQFTIYNIGKGEKLEFCLKDFVFCAIWEE